MEQTVRYGSLMLGPRGFVVAGFVLMLLTALVEVATAGPMEDANAAYHRADYAAVLRILSPLAVQGDAQAQTGIGVLYENGQGVPQNKREAVMWYRKAADQNYGNAQFILAQMYATGQGVPTDFDEALKLYRKAAANGQVNAQAMLGYRCAAGDGVPKDEAEAAKWLRMAADQGDPMSEYNLGYLYATGGGVPLDLIEAHKWFNISATQFHLIGSDSEKLATKSLSHIEGYMTREQVKEAWNRAVAWADKYSANVSHAPSPPPTSQPPPRQRASQDQVQQSVSAGEQARARAAQEEMAEAIRVLQVQQAAQAQAARDAEKIQLIRAGLQLLFPRPPPRTQTTCRFVGPYFTCW